MEKEVSEVDRKLLLKIKYLDKINYYLGRNPISQDELYIFVRKFFAEYLKLEYEFTYEELSLELNKVFIKPQVKENINSFLIKLSESEYLEENTLGTNELNNFLKELSVIINSIIYDDIPIKKNDSFIKKILNINNSTASMAISNLSNAIDEVNSSITNGNIDTAKKSYINLLKKFDSLNKEDKKRLHTEMSELYQRLQMAIANPSTITPVVSVSNANNSPNVSKPAKELVKIELDTNANLNILSDSKVILDETSKDNSLVELPKLTPIVEFDTDNHVPVKKETTNVLFGSDININTPKIETANTSSATSHNAIARTTFASDSGIDVKELKKSIVSGAENVLFDPNAISANAKTAIKPIASISKKETALNSTTTTKVPETKETLQKEVKKDEIKTNDVKKEEVIKAKEVIISSNSPPIIITPVNNNPNIINTKTKEASTLNTPTPKTPQVNDKLIKLFNKINDDIISDSLEKAKVSYADALIIYNNSSNDEKLIYYKQLHDIFKKLDDSLHKKVLNSLLDTHLENNTTTNTALKDTVSNVKISISPKKIDNTLIDNKMLPVVTNNDISVVRLYELIEESYFNINNTNLDIAMLKYFKALELYRKLSIKDKEKTYSELYILFKKLSTIKK